MRLAIICLASLQSSAGVEMLAKYFAHLPADLYVHVDAKVSDDAYRPIESRCSNVHLLAQRLPIWWGGFNIVRATIAALRYARGAGRSTRFLLLSEDSVPLMAPASPGRTSAIGCRIPAFIPRAGGSGEHD